MRYQVFVVTVACAAFVIGTAVAGDSPTQSDAVHRVIVLSGFAARGVDGVEEVMTPIASREFMARHAERRDYAVEGVRREMTASAYSRRVAPVVAGALSASEWADLAELLKSPLFQRWVAVLRERDAQLSEVDAAWKTEVAEMYYRKFALRR
jgi:hypothetical protein